MHSGLYVSGDRFSPSPKADLAIMQSEVSLRQSASLQHSGMDFSLFNVVFQNTRLALY